MDVLREHFEASAKRGVVLSAAQLMQHARKKGLEVSEVDVRKIRHEFKFSAFSSPHQKPLRYMSSSIHIYGAVQVSERTLGATAQVRRLRDEI